MEDLIKNDATFEVFANSEGAEMLNNRTLLSYPSEKSSFDVFLGFEGEVPPATTGTGTTATKPKYDPEKIAGAITSGASALGSVVGTVQAFKGDGTKAPSRRKALKEVCGRKPIFGKEKKGYTKCVADYNAGKIGGLANTKAPETTPTEITTEETPPTNNNKKIIIGVVIVAVLVTAFIGFKKGWFGKKAG